SVLLIQPADPDPVWVRSQGCSTAKEVKTPVRPGPTGNLRRSYRLRAAPNCRGRPQTYFAQRRPQSRSVRETFLWRNEQAAVARSPPPQKRAREPLAAEAARSSLSP